MFSNPTINDFKTYFSRDFIFGITPNTVMDADISNAYRDANVYVNPDLFPTQDGYVVGYLNLAAHFMVQSLQTSSQGPSGSFSWLTNSKSVGNVSEGIAIPQRILDNPEFAWLTKTGYGVKYLMLVLPLLSGVMYTVQGKTHA